MEFQGINLKDMSAIELKALAYDLLAQREQNGLQLQQVNQLIAQKVNECIPQKDSQEK